MDTKKVNTGIHEAQEPHGAADCQINQKPHNHPSVDCGHYVNEGPGVGVPKYDGKNGVVSAGMGYGPASSNKDQDENNGPGVR